MDWVHPHRWRYTKVTQMVKDGISLYEISKFMGHSSIKTTETYIVGGVDFIRDKYNRVQQRFAEVHQRIQRNKSLQTPEKHLMNSRKDLNETQRVSLKTRKIKRL